MNIKECKNIYKARLSWEKTDKIEANFLKILNLFFYILLDIFKKFKYRKLHMNSLEILVNKWNSNSKQFKSLFSIFFFPSKYFSPFSFVSNFETQTCLTTSPTHLHSSFMTCVTVYFLFSRGDYHFLIIMGNCLGENNTEIFFLAYMF